MLKANESATRPETGAEAVLLALKGNGIDYLFANAGTDFPSIIEAFAGLSTGGRVPVPVTVPHETASVAMAHGYYLVTGRPQAVMVHVNVGLANAAMGVINAASDNVPVIVMSGRTPFTEHGRTGARATPIQYGQEMYDQTSIVRDVTKFNYEMRYAEQGGSLVARAVGIAMSEPRGPVYLSLPREPLAEAFPPEHFFPAASQSAASPAVPQPDAINEAARLLAGAKSPLILCQRSEPSGATAVALATLAERFAIPVVEPFSIRNVLPSAHPMLLGYDVRDALAEADVVLVVDSGVPWIEKMHRPKHATAVISVGPDPLFQRMPVRSYQTDLSLAGDPEATLRLLHESLARLDAPGTDARRKAIAERSAARRNQQATAEPGDASGAMTAEWMSRCLSDVLGEDGVVFSELGVVPSAMDLKGPNRLFTAPHSGGLGWAMPAALGAQLHDRSRLCVACVGDGSYMFANPVACHQIAEAMRLPILTVIKNNGIWNAVRRSVVNSYPGGKAATANEMPLVSLEPSPDFQMIARASRAHAERVEGAEDLPAALERALHAIRIEQRSALLDVRVARSDKH
jgi:acetolactate synthase-1/2/3 large subunit